MVQTKEFHRAGYIYIYIFVFIPYSAVAHGVTGEIQHIITRWRYLQMLSSSVSRVSLSFWRWKSSHSRQNDLFVNKWRDMFMCISFCNVVCFSVSPSSFGWNVIMTVSGWEVRVVFVTQDFTVCSSGLHRVYPLKFMQFCPRVFCCVPRLAGRYRLWAFIW